tara:strand:- start:1120 stop:1380 length:261 start_codon:yes stop_codon:yes gene_type:complete
MSSRFSTPKKYRGIGLKKFSELDTWYFKHIDVLFTNVFQYARVVASAPPIYTKKSIPVSPVFSRISKPTAIVNTRVTQSPPTYTRI